MGRLPQSNEKTPEKDVCQTPSYALEPLLKYLDLYQEFLGRTLRIWESAAGEGLLAGYLAEAGYYVFPTDIQRGQNYFEYEPPFQYDIEVTNVPFSCKIAWMVKALERGKPFALLMPSDTRFTAGGSSLVRQHGIELLSPIQRIDFKMPNKGWGDEEGDSTAQFHASWWCRGLDLGDKIVDVDILKSTPRLEKLRSGWRPRLGITEYDSYLLNKPVKSRKV